MTESIFDLLNGVQKENTTDPNSRVLIIDGLNLYLRVFAVNGMLNDRGVPVGGVMGFLKSLALSIREVNPTRVIVVFDGKGGSTRRRKILPSYKNNRKPGKRMTRWDAWKNYEEEKASQKSQIERLIQYLSALPINVIQIDNIEADDTIAYITNNLLEKEVTIMSADQDFLQLVNERVTVWSPIKKKFYTPELVIKDYGVPAHNFLMYKVLMGDKSDNIEGVKGLGPKKLPKIIPDIITERVLDLDSIVQEALEGEEPMHNRIVASEHQLEINEKLMDLKNPPISGELKRQIRDIMNQPINLLSRNSFTTMYHNDCMGNALQIPDAWLTQHFVRLNSYAESTHE